MSRWIDLASEKKRYIISKDNKSFISVECDIIFFLPLWLIPKFFLKLELNLCLIFFTY